MYTARFLIWAASVNGEGSSRVSCDLIRASSSVFCDVTCIVTRGSILYCQLSGEDLSSSIRLVVLPGCFRLYIVQFFVKTFLPLFLFADLALVLDDFPFLIPFRQVLYFHQSNLLFPRTLMWHLKSIVFSFLSLFRPRVAVQTVHVRDNFCLRFMYSTSKVSVTYHAPAC